MPMKELLEERIKELAINEDNTILRVTVWGDWEWEECDPATPGAQKSGWPGNPCIHRKYKQYYYLVSGDCCNEVWFNDILGVKDILCDGGYKEMITGIRVRPIEQLETEDDYRLRAYGYTLEGPRGRCDIIFRNSDNGYYGADCKLMTQDELSWYINTTSNFTPVEEDWTA